MPLSRASAAAELLPLVERPACAQRAHEGGTLRLVPCGCGDSGLPSSATCCESANGAHHTHHMVRAGSREAKGEEAGGGGRLTQHERRGFDTLDDGRAYLWLVVCLEHVEPDNALRSR